jgi:DNA (cytosine-5)-methyltransferase 1
MCEIDDSARAVLKAKFSGCKLYRDVSQLPYLPRKVDAIVAGFPCQDLSQAGRTAGINGGKSGVVSELWRLIDISHPELVVLENVPFMLRLHKGAALRLILENLEQRKYSWAYRVVDTRAFGLPHRRERVIMVASRSSDPRGILLSEDAGVPIAKPRSGSKPCGFYWTEGNSGLGWAVDSIPPLKGGSSVGIPSPPAIYMPPGRFVVPSISDAERLQGFPRGWTSSAEKVASRGARWRLVGNAVSVPVAKWIGQKLSRPGSYCSDLDSPFSFEAGLPRAAWGADGVRRSAAVSAWPRNLRSQGLRSYLTPPMSPLSHGAAAGFLGRLRASGLRRDEAFFAALEEYVSETSKRAKESTSR